MSQIRPAASILLIRRDIAGEPRILMGQRGAKAVFMPSKYVFPGGAVDAQDNHPLPLPLDEISAQKLALVPPFAGAFVAAAIRELQEETGLILDPARSKLRLIFRAITPPKRPRRYDACFFLAEAETVLGDLDDFSQAQEELSHLHWLTMSKARELDLPFITEVILAEAAHILAGGTQDGLPFFDNSAEETHFRRL